MLDNVNVSKVHAKNSETHSLVCTKSFHVIHLD